MPAITEPSAKAATWKARTSMPHEIGDPLVVVHRRDRDPEAGGEQQPYQRDHDRPQRPRRSGNRMKAATG